MKLCTVTGLFGLLIILVSGCRSSSDVISERGIQKRKYRSGFYVAKRGTPPKVRQQVSPRAPAALDAASDEIQPLRSEPPVINTEEVSAPDIVLPKAQREALETVRIPQLTIQPEAEMTTVEVNHVMENRPDSIKAKPAYNPNTGRIGLVLFLLGLIAIIVGSILFSTGPISAAGTSASALVVSLWIVGSVLMTIGMVMLFIHLMRIILGL